MKESAVVKRYYYFAIKKERKKVTNGLIYISFQQRNYTSLNSTPIFQNLLWQNHIYCLSLILCATSLPAAPSLRVWHWVVNNSMTETFHNFSEKLQLHSQTRNRRGHRLSVGTRGRSRERHSYCLLNGGSIGQCFSLARMKNTMFQQG